MPILSKKGGARFGLIPLNLGNSDIAVPYEFMVDENTGHLYTVKDDGVPYSKTLELEERLNKLIMQQIFMRNDLSFCGGNMEIATYDKTHYSKFGNFQAKIIQGGDLDFDAIPFHCSPGYGYRMVINYSGTPLNVGNVYAKNATTKNKIGNPFKISPGPFDSTGMVAFEFDLTESSGINIIFGLNCPVGTVINSVFILKERLVYNRNQSEIVINPATPQSSFFAGNLVKSSSGEFTNYLGAHYSVTTSNPVYINLQKQPLIPGDYAISIIAESTSDVNVKVYDAIQSTTTPMETKVFSTSGITPFKENLKNLTTSITIPVHGARQIAIESYSANIYNISIKLLSAAEYDKVNV